MNKLFVVLFKSCRIFFLFLYDIYSGVITRIKLKGNGVKYGKNLSTKGIPQVDVELEGTFVIGNNFRMNNGKYHNKIGRQQSCMFIVSKGAKLIIGDHVGISGSAIICKQNIVIGDYVKIGGNTCIYDTDFHSLDARVRKDSNRDRFESISKHVYIKNNAFIGAHTTIFKGVTIGENSIVAGCSVVTKDIPDNEIWGGNPIRFIRKINE